MKLFGVSIVAVIILVLIGYLAGVKFPSTGKMLLSKVGM